MNLRKIFENKERFVLLLFLFSAVIYFVVESFVHPLNQDEREHFYMTYLVSLGEVPYVDFFEHHHPLMWYLFVPVLKIFDESFWIFHILRGCGIVVTLVTGRYVYKICKLTENVNAALFAVGCFLGSAIVGEVGSEFRPDNLMLMCYIIGLYYFFAYISEKNFKFLQISMLSFTISFLFLQKIIILFCPLFFVVLTALIKKELFLKNLLKSLVFPCFVVGTFLLIISQMGAMKAYVQSNWLLNGVAFKAVYARDDLTYYPLIVAVLSLFLGKNRTDFITYHLIFMYLLSMILVLYILPYARVIYAYPQYFILIYPMLAIVMGYLYTDLEKYKRISLVFIVLVSAYHLYYADVRFNDYDTISHGLKESQEKDHHIYINTTKDDKVLCNIDDGVFGGFRKCAEGYYSFSFTLAAPAHQVQFPKHKILTVNDIIKKERPKVLTRLYDYNCTYDRGTKSVNCDLTSSSIDIDWLLKNYVYYGTIWIRKY